MLDDLYRIVCKIFQCRLVFRCVFGEGRGLETHNIWNLWTRSPLVCFRGVLWLVLLLLACMSMAFVLVDIIKHGTWERIGSQQGHRGMWVCVRKGSQKDLVFFGTAINHTWYKRVSGVFYKARQGPALESKCTRRRARRLV